jgi:hypothetical protein
VSELPRVFSASLLDPRTRVGIHLHSPPTVLTHTSIQAGNGEKREKEKKRKSRKFLTCHMQKSKKLSSLVRRDRILRGGRREILEENVFLHVYNLTSIWLF